MENILEELYYGKILPAEQCSPQEKAIRETHEQHYKDFVQALKNLNPPLNEQFNNILNEQFDWISSELSQTFTYGFRLGAKMIAEVFKDN